MVHAVKTNSLINEKSPYLLQHAYNPVNWYPWGDEAFELAKKENKPIFLSIGYSTCHWCHVMEHESFEDPEVAKLLNEYFISIKVDREERPDIDSIYMTVCQMMTGSGGWPLTIMMTPDKKPFFAGTYFPKESRYERVGMLDLLLRINDFWKSRNAEVLNSASEITDLLNKISISTSGNELSENDLKSAFEQFNFRFDKEHGGFGERPKFPTPHNLLFLLRYWKGTGSSIALEMVEKTLQEMRLGGIFDHLGFGFHRYSTDERWLVPHFEKMLYDQAMLAMAYTETYQATKKEEYKKTASEIFEYVLRDMTSQQEGGFYSAEDADSEGHEGKFYIWQEEEIKNILSKDEAKFVIKRFNLEKDGENILYLKHPLSEAEEKLFKSIREKLFNERKKRIHPHKDDKILTDWNGLMIAALAKGSQIVEIESPKYIEVCNSALDFIQKNMLKNGRLLHRYRDGEAKVNAYLDDYAFLIWGLIELFEATFENKYLDLALSLNEDLIKHFWDEKDGGFYFTDSENKDVLLRKKEIYDGAIPSGNSVAMLNLLRLSHITSDEKLKDYAIKLEKAFSNSIKETPSAYTQLLCALDFKLSVPCEIVISGNPNSDDTRSMLDTVRKQFLPNKVLLLNIKNKDFPMLENKATAYVCSNFSCKEPTNDVNKMLKYLFPSP